jgi:hypothetical protein
MKRIAAIFVILIILPLSSFISNSNAFEKDLEYEWEQVVNHGFQNKNNLHAWSIKAYKNFLYVGTRNVADGCQIYRSPTGNKDTWVQINENGFGNDNKSEGVRNMIVYKDLLWVITNSWDYGTQVWVTNGEVNEKEEIINWKKANLNGFGAGSNFLSSRALGIYCDKLYVGSQSRDGHPLIFRYDGPTDFENINPDNWTLIKDFYDESNYDKDLALVGDLVNFTNKNAENHLYVILMTGVTPLFRELKLNFSLINLLKTLRIIFFGNSQIWRYDGINWELIDCKIFKNTNRMGSCFKIINNSLYIGTANWLGGEIWKTEDGKNWMQVVKRGFYRPFNLWIWMLFEFEKRLIAGTLNPVLGCQVWASTNDNPNCLKDFKKFSRNGMDGSKLLNIFELPQDGARSFESFCGKLYVGTTNWIDLNTFLTGTGCEVWRIGNIDKLCNS